MLKCVTKNIFNVGFESPLLKGLLSPVHTNMQEAAQISRPANIRQQHTLSGPPLRAGGGGGYIMPADVRSVRTAFQYALWNELYQDAA